MCTQAAAKRRRRQASGGYKNVCQQLRPHYKKRSASASAARLQALIEKERRMKQGSKKK